MTHTTTEVSKAYEIALFAYRQMLKHKPGSHEARKWGRVARLCRLRWERLRREAAAE